MTASRPLPENDGVLYPARTTYNTRKYGISFCLILILNSLSNARIWKQLCLLSEHCQYCTTYTAHDPLADVQLPLSLPVSPLSVNFYG